MITTSHVIFNATILGSKKHPERNWPIVLGAIFPDIPTFLMLISPIYYALNIKSLNYYLFQNATDWFHSIPLALLGFLICLPFRYQKGLYFFISMALHDLEDLPVHAQIAHREFLPVSQYVFHSPISYWEPGYHAALVAPLEWLLVLFCGVILWRRGLNPFIKFGLLFVIIFQAVLLVYSLGFHWWLE